MTCVFLLHLSPVFVVALSSFTLQCLPRQSQGIHIFLEKSGGSGI